ncbi:MFS transporter [Bailinhaonella thermotolerans]|uniref:MFS transporter n=1 Tax=Bailinhaonella thermotolerans TaxID=1070861 RepID=A0A3A4AUG4_9ACTN|nr:MFS transporter [Bailinhaonella thermotolerans]RJL23172.1 MFS transporter [Bailinhaonella thermotolerans]
MLTSKETPHGTRPSAQRPERLLAAHGRFAVVSTGAWFAVFGVTFGAWMTQIPRVQAERQLSPGTLGLLLASMPMGMLLASVLLGRAVDRFGSGPVARYSGWASAVTIALLALAWTPWALAGALFLCGAARSTFNVASYAHAALLEQARGRSLSSRFGAAFSGGTLVGAATSMVCAQLRIPTAAVLLGAAALQAAVMIATAPATRIRGPRRQKTRTRQKGPRARSMPMLILGAQGMLYIACEAMPTDWGGVLVQTEKHLPAHLSALPFVALCLAITLVRLCGDRLIDRFGPDRVVRWGSVVAAAAMLIALASPNPFVTVAALALFGLGIAPLRPLLFASAARVGGDNAGAMIGYANAAGLVGVMLSQMLVGGIAELTNLTTALLLAVAAVMITAVAVAPLRATAPASEPAPGPAPSPAHGAASGPGPDEGRPGGAALRYGGAAHAVPEPGHPPAAAAHPWGTPPGRRAAHADPCPPQGPRTVAGMTAAPTPMDSSVAAILSGFGLAAPATRDRVEHLIGELLAARGYQARLAGLRHRVAVLEAPPHVAALLRYDADELLRRIQDEIGAEEITRIAIRSHTGSP